MLRKVTSHDQKNWDNYLPYLLFAFREVPQQAPGYAPFELVYGRQPKGPLDILQHSWTAPDNTAPNVYEYVTSVQKRLEEMTAIAHENKQVAKNQQKAWYDKHTKHREFIEGEYVLVLAPHAQNKLQFHWSGPYSIVRKVSPVTYVIDMPEKRRRHRLCHVNRWHTPTAEVLYCNAVPDGPPDGSLEESTDIPTWKDGDSEDLPIISPELSSDQRSQLLELLRDYDHILSDMPNLIANTGSAAPIAVAQRRIPQAYCDQQSRK